MVITKHKYVSIEHPRKDILQISKRILTISNPAYSSNERLGVSNFATTRTLKYYEYENDVLKVPTGFWETNFPSLGGDDRRTEGISKVIKEFPFNATLQPIQEEAVNTLSANTNGVLSAPTGSGKTVIALALIKKLSRKTLFVVDTIDLARQFSERCTQFLGFTPGLIGSGKFEVNEISVGILQTLVRLSDEQYTILNSAFGCVIVDEVHILPSTTFFYAISKLSAKYKYGLSATVHGRSDGLTNVIFWGIGREVFKISLEEASSKLCIPKFEYVETNFEFPIFNSREYSQLLDHLSVDVERNNLIVEVRNKYPTKKAIILVNRKEHARILSELLENSKFLTSDTKAKEREATLNSFLKGSLSTLIGTFKLLAKGLDSSLIDIAIIAGPSNSEIDVKQLIGRTMRPGEGKEALIIDVYDPKTGMLKSMALNRKRWYKKYIELGKNEKI